MVVVVDGWVVAVTAMVEVGARDDDGAVEGPAQAAPTSSMRRINGSRTARNGTGERENGDGSRRVLGDRPGVPWPPIPSDGESPVSDRKEQVRENLDGVLDSLRGISRWMYENPELAYEEYKSSARLVEFLAGSGFNVEYPSHGLDTAFAARAGSQGPQVVICAEYDALPGVGHACGHNLIATAAIGAGHALLPLLDDLGIRLTVL